MTHVSGRFTIICRVPFVLFCHFVQYILVFVLNMEVVLNKSKTEFFVLTNWFITSDVFGAVDTCTHIFSRRSFKFPYNFFSLKENNSNRLGFFKTTVFSNCLTKPENQMFSIGVPSSFSWNSCQKTIWWA